MSTPGNGTDPETETQTQAALTANKIASAAVGISIAAFLIAYLQLILGNLMSGNALWKTNHAAIGVVARYRSWRPGVRKIKILYPQIDFTRILDAARKSWDTSIRFSPMEPYAVHNDLRWKRVSAAEEISSTHIR
jgi:hypothetical protein